MMRSESTESMMPLRLASTTAPESRAVTPSMPVPTNGACARSSGTDCRYKLFRTHVDVIDFLSADQHEVPGLPGVDQVRHDLSAVIKFDVRLCDDVTVLLPGREVEREGFNIGRAFAPLFQISVRLLDFVLLQVIADVIIAIAGIEDSDEIQHTPIAYTPIRRFDEPVIVDPCIAAQGRDQTDVGTFRGLNRT